MIRERDIEELADKAELAAVRTQNRQAQEARQKAELFDSVSGNLAHVREVLQETPALQTYLETTGNSITLVKRIRMEIIGPPPLFNGPPLPIFHRSKIAVDARGVVIHHELSHIYIEGPLARPTPIDTEASLGLIEDLWEHYEARPLIKAFASMGQDQIRRKLSKGIK